MRLLLAAVVLGLATALPDTIEWETFKSSHGKSYDSAAEEQYRMQVYADTKTFVAHHNAEYAAGRKTFTVGINKFADMTEEEVRQLYTARPRLSRSAWVKTATAVVGEERRRSEIDPPSAVDWRESGVVTEVKDQGQCGSCWAFSSTGAIESAWALAGRGLRVLSEQQLMDCSGDFHNHGCSGGTMDQAFRYLESSGGIMSEDSYPYTAADGSECLADSSLFIASITNHTDVLAAGKEPLLADALARVGPISVSIDASQRSFQLYSGGVYSEPACSSIWLDHGVLAVGYGTTTSTITTGGAGAGNGTDFWLVKNSWGADWGEDGYIRMVRDGTNQCGIASEAVYPVV